MKTSQRLRLTALLAKDQATLTTDEKAELTTLQALAVANPDASKDTSDTTAAAPVVAPVAAAPTVAAPATTLASMLKGAIASLGEKAKLGTELATAKAALAERDTKISEQAATIVTQASAITTFAGVFGLTLAEVSGKDAAALATILTGRISALAIEQLASAGVPSAALPAQAKSEASEDTIEGIQAKMKTETDGVKLGQLAAKANALRDKQWGKN